MILELINRVADTCLKEEVTEDKTITRWFSMDIDRDYFDFSPNPKEWQQYDTESDAYYFGIWVNVGTKQILNYAEGDITLTSCLNRESFKHELEELQRFFGDPPPAATIIDGDKVYSVFDLRPNLEE